MDRFLVFGTAGYAWGTWHTNYAFTGGTPFFTNNVDANSGWTAGGGLEYAFTNNLSARIEYRHTDLGSATASSAAANSFSRDAMTIDDVRVGFSYKFGGRDEPRPLK
jgi:outer membrane immunogenic protein